MGEESKKFSEVHANLRAAFENFEEVYKNSRNKCKCVDSAFENLQEIYYEYEKFIGEQICLKVN